MTSLKSLVIALALGVAAAVMTCASPMVAQSAPAKPVPLIEPAAVKGLIAVGAKITIVDVRRPDETAQGRIAGAILMPLDTLPNTYSSLPKKGKLIVYCRSGRRSAQAVQFLLDHGYKNAVSMNGGYIAWTAP